MPAEPWNEAVRMVACGLAVAALAAPVAVVGWRVARRSGEPILPRWRPWRVPWAGFDVFLAFLVLGPFLLPPMTTWVLSGSGFFVWVYGHPFPSGRPVGLEPSAAVAGAAAATAAREQVLTLLGIASLWGSVLALPVQLLVILWARNVLYPRQPSSVRGGIAGRLALAAIAWAVLAVTVHLIHQVVNLVFAQLGWAPEEHPLARLVRFRPALDQGLLVVSACVVAPLLEELYFRGILLPWVLRRRARAWSVLLAAVALVGALCYSTNPSPAALTRGPFLFIVGLAVGGAVLGLSLRRKRLTLGAIYASAALFAAVHSTVWPTPIPLFVLGLGLGYLAVRTRGVLVPAVVHGLFNAVSALFVLTG